MSEQINSVDFWVEELTKDINPEHFDFYENFVSYMQDEKIGRFGSWMWDRGYNAGLVNLQTKVNTYCVLQKKDDTKWIDNKCSACGKGIENLIDSREWYENETPNYCPFCGKRFMIEG